MFNSRSQRRRRKGATLVLIALLMVIIVGMVAFAVDVGRMYLVRSQLQTAVDSGALAAAMQLKVNPNDLEAAAASADDFVQANRVGWWGTVDEDAITVEIGTWEAETRDFSIGGTEPNAVRVSASQDNEPIFFGRVFQQTTFSVPRAAVASGSNSALDIMLVLDLSGSMADQGRIEALRNSAPAFVDVIEDVRGDDLIGVMVYGALPSTFKPASYPNAILYTAAPVSLYPTGGGSTYVGVIEETLTDDFAYLRNNTLSSSTLKAGKYDNYTPIGAAIRDAAHYLDTTSDARDNAKKIIVLMSDGYANKPESNAAQYARNMATYAAGRGITIYTTSLGNEADLTLMQDIATIGGGQHFNATGVGEAQLTENLTEAFREIAGAIKRTQLVQ